LPADQAAGALRSCGLDGRAQKPAECAALRKVELPVQIIVGSDDERQPNVTGFLEPFVDNRNIFMYAIESGGHFFRDLNLEETV
jgi:hypothetical protein